ncbi:MAG TPA: hypothetical protein VIF62_35195 [Labilithrix sp.]|jgi:hypothetical protein
MWKTIIALGAVGSAIGAVACGGGDSGSGSDGQQQSADQKQQSSSATQPASSCVAKTDKGNEKGVGAYCDATTKCASGMLCTADVGETPTFCTILCNADGDCGSGSTCYHDPRGSACVPSKCLDAK